VNYTRFLLKAKLWVRNPPSEKRVMLVVAAIAICLLIVGIEKFIGWPEWATVEKMRGFRP